MQQFYFFFNSLTLFVLNANKRLLTKGCEKKAALQMNYFPLRTSDIMTAKRQSHQQCKLCSYIQPLGPCRTSVITYPLKHNCNGG